MDGDKDRGSKLWRRDQASDNRHLSLVVISFPESHTMIGHAAIKGNKSLEPPLPYPGATPDAERAKKPALPEPPYEPYVGKRARSEPPYEPYNGT